jgi:hypothetical protein
MIQAIMSSKSLPNATAAPVASPPLAPMCSTEAEPKGTIAMNMLEDMDCSDDENEEQTTASVGKAMLVTEDLLQVQSIIAQIQRPPSQQPLPSNFGSPSHGKLKSSQWATGIEFDLTVALVKLWLSEKSNGDDMGIQQQRVKAINATIYLSIALRWATSSIVTKAHAERYLHWMRKYLDAILDLHPEMDLKPSHHAALHIPEFLERFGPMRGWWMYFFEQLIGLLQLVKINYKFGKGLSVYLCLCCTNPTRRRDRSDSAQNLQLNQPGQNHFGTSGLPGNSARMYKDSRGPFTIVGNGI